MDHTEEQIQEEYIEAEEENPFYLELKGINEKLGALISFQKVNKQADSFEIGSKCAKTIEEIYRVQHLDFLRKKELATLLGITTSLVDKWIGNGDIPYIKHHGFVLFKREDIDTFLEQKRKA